MSQTHRQAHRDCDQPLVGEGTAVAHWMAEKSRSFYASRTHGKSSIWGAEGSHPQRGATTKLPLRNTTGRKQSPRRASLAGSASSTAKSPERMLQDPAGCWVLLTSEEPGAGEATCAVEGRHRRSQNAAAGRLGSSSKHCRRLARVAHYVRKRSVFPLQSLHTSFFSFF